MIEELEETKPVVIIDINGKYPIISVERKLFSTHKIAFEIDNQDLPGKYNWRKASQKANDGWRLPNLHELFIMQMITQNISNPLFTHLAGLYWCNTGNHFRAYRVYFASGGYYIGKYFKFKVCNVRMIRDII